MLLGLALFLDELEVFFAEHETVGEVLLLDDLVVGQFLWCALEEDAALKQHVGAVCDAERVLDVVVGDEDADVAKLQSPNDALDVLHGYGVHAREGLVEHDKLRVDGQAACYLRASPLASRESVSQVLAHLLQAKLLDEALHLCDLFVVGELGALQHGMMLSSTLILRNTLASCGR